MRLEHVAINVPEPDAMAEWYVAHLGLRVARHVPQPNHTYFLAAAAGSLIEIYRNPAAPVPDYPAIAPLMLHFAFAVADIETELARLIAAGATQHAPIEDTPAGDRLVFLRDPWQVTIQLAQRHTPLQ
jgi:glyoxylase I family protein